MTTNKSGKRKQALAAAVSLLGSSLGIGTQESAVGAETVHLYLKANATGEKIGTQHKGTAPSVRAEGYTEQTGDTLNKSPRDSTQQKGNAPSLTFTFQKVDLPPESKQIKLDNTQSNQMKSTPTGGSH